MASVRQTNFSAGELEPLLHGRTDLPLYSQGMRTVRNFFITKNGAAVSRPGTLFVNTTRLGVLVDDPRPGIDGGVVRLIPFVVSDTESYVLEFGWNVIRFHTLGRTVESSPGVPYEVFGTGIQPEDLPKLKYAQVGNTLSVCVPSSAFTAPMELTYAGPLSWTWGPTSLAPPNPGELPDIGASAMPNPFDPTAPSTTLTTTPFMLLEPLPSADPDHPVQEWNWGYTALVQDVATGIVLESRLQLVTQSTDGVDSYPGSPPVQTALAGTRIALYPDQPVTLTRLGAGNAPGLDYRILAFRIYRGRADVWGWVGDTRTRYFDDVGIEPDFSIQPPLGSNPWRVLGSNGATAFTVPLAVAFFQERRCYGGALAGPTFDGRPGTLYLSATGDYYNFDQRVGPPHIDDEALIFDLASYRREEIRHLIGISKLVILTDSSAWIGSGSDGGALTFANPSFVLTDHVGAAHVTPLVIDGSVLFVRIKGSGARALIPQDSFTPYQGVDITEHSRHLFVGKDRTIVDWTYAEDPWSIVWAVRADGALLSLTYSRDRQMAAWTRHDTDGEYESVCSIPEGEEDAVYVVVKRTINGAPIRYIERMTSRVRRVFEDDDNPTFTSTPTSADTDSLYPTDVCLDCAFTYAGVPTGTIEGVEHLEGKDVWVVARGLAPIQATVLGGEVAFLENETPSPNAVDDSNTPIFVAHVGLAYTCDLETLSLRGGDATTRQKLTKSVGFELDSARGIKAGQDFDHLRPWQQRTVADGFSSPSAATVLLYTLVDSTWDKDARACLRQSLPLPVTVVGITREVVSGDPS